MSNTPNKDRHRGDKRCYPCLLHVFLIFEAPVRALLRDWNRFKSTDSAPDESKQNHLDSKGGGLENI